MTIGTKVTELEELLEVEGDDVLMAVDTSDTSGSAVGTSKKVNIDTVVDSMDLVTAQGALKNLSMVVGANGKKVDVDDNITTDGDGNIELNTINGVDIKSDGTPTEFLAGS